jgi:hypothetical protein
MRRTIALTICIVFTSLSGLFAFDWEGAGLKTVEEKEIDGEKRIILEDGKGVQVTVDFTGELSDGNAASVVEAYRFFQNWDRMKPERISITLRDGGLTAVVIPSSYNYRNIDFVPHMPSGMIFTLGDVNRYNFRIVKDDFFIRIKGDFISENMLNQKIFSALDDPMKYLEANNPKYIVNKLQRQEEEIENLKYNMIVLANRGCFGKIKPVSKKDINRIIAVKQDHPDYDSKQVEDVLKEKDIKISRKIIELVFVIYFNEIPE